MNRNFLTLFFIFHICILVSAKDVCGYYAVEHPNDWLHFQLHLKKDSTFCVNYGEHRLWGFDTGHYTVKDDTLSLLFDWDICEVGIAISYRTDSLLSGLKIYLSEEDSSVNRLLFRSLFDLSIEMDSLTYDSLNAISYKSVSNTEILLNDTFKITTNERGIAYFPDKIHLRNLIIYRKSGNKKIPLRLVLDHYKIKSSNVLKITLVDEKTRREMIPDGYMDYNWFRKKFRIKGRRLYNIIPADCDVPIFEMKKISPKDRWIIMDDCD